MIIKYLDRWYWHISNINPGIKYLIVIILNQLCSGRSNAKLSADIANTER